MLCFYLKSFITPMEPSSNASSPPNSSGKIDIKLSEQEPLHLDWQNRWLKGHEYAFILKNIDFYCNKYGFIKLNYKTHPDSIYENPINGMIYFVKGTGVGTDFGFPRVAKKKKYRWKKMNFTTDLPKQNPHVTYVVASAMKSQQFQEQQQMANFRMHAVIPYKDRINEYSGDIEYILCHVRKIQQKKTQNEEPDLKECISNNFVDFYKLFAYLHNFSRALPKADNFSL